MMASVVVMSREDAQRALSVLSAFPMPSDPNLNDDWHASIANLRAALSCACGNTGVAS